MQLHRTVAVRIIRRMLDLRLLQAFVTVADSGTIARAADRLHVSQSPLSRQIMALERQLGTALFARTGRRLRITAAGARFLGEARALVDQAAELERFATLQRQGQAGPLRLGVAPAVAWHGCLGAALATLRRERPQLTPQLVVRPARDLLAGLMDGELDLALLRSRPGHPALAGDKLADEPLVLMAIAGADRPTTLAALARTTWIEPRGSRHPGLTAALRAAGLDARQRFEVDDLTAGLCAVRAGLGVMLAQASLAEALAGVVAWPPPFPCPPLEVHLAWRPVRGKAAPALLPIIDIIRRSARLGAAR